MTKFELIEDCATQRTAIMVLAPRGGLSAAAAGDLLARLGCDAPASERDSTSRLAELSNAVLESSGTLVDDWAAFNSRWLASPKATEFVKRALKLLDAEYRGSYLSVFQDASTARLLPFWNVVLDRAGIVPRYLFLVRAPSEVADDLYERSEIEQPAGYLIWLRTVLEAEANSRGRLRAFVHPAQLGDDPTAAMNSVASSLQLTFPRDIQTTFASRNFRLKQFRELLHAGKVTAMSGPGALAPDWVTATHHILKDWASNGETAEGRFVLDGIREAFDEAVPAFLGLGRRAAPSNAKPVEIVQELESARDAARVEIDELREINADQMQALEDAQHQLRERYSEIVTLTRMLGTETSSARKFERNAERLAGIARALERGAASGRTAKWLGWILPWRWHLQRVKRSLERERLFDVQAYLRANPDVESAGADPLRHYLAHGAGEGRPLGIE